MKLTIVMSMQRITFDVLKKVVQTNRHIASTSGSIAAIAIVSSIIITTSTTR